MKFGFSQSLHSNTLVGPRLNPYHFLSNSLQFIIHLSSYLYTVCPESKCTDFLFKYLLDLPEITSDLLQSMTLGKIHSGSNVSSTVHSSTGSHFP